MRLSLPNCFVYLLDIPRKQDEKAIEYFTRELEEIIAEEQNRDSLKAEGESRTGDSFPGFGR